MLAGVAKRLDFGKGLGWEKGLITESVRTDPSSTPVSEACYQKWVHASKKMEFQSFGLKRLSFT